MKMGTESKFILLKKKKRLLVRFRKQEIFSTIQLLNNDKSEGLENRNPKDDDIFGTSAKLKYS